jgi:hypothetical protein
MAIKDLWARWRAPMACPYNNNCCWTPPWWSSLWFAPGDTKLGCPKCNNTNPTGMRMRDEDVRSWRQRGLTERLLGIRRPC